MAWDVFFFFLTGRHRCSSREKIHCMHPVNSPVQYFFSREQIVWKIHTALRWQGRREKSGNQLDLSRALGFFFSICALRHEEGKKTNTLRRCFNNTGGMQNRGRYSDTFQRRINGKACDVSLLPTSFHGVTKPQRQETSKVFQFGATSP